MSFLSLWRDSRSDSSAPITSINGSEKMSMKEESSTQCGQFNLKSYDSNLPAVSSLPETKQLVVKQAIHNLFESRYFNVCNLDSALSIIGARQGGDAYKLLHALHCVDYSKMHPDLRERIPYLVNECLRQQDNVIDATDVALNGVL